MSEEFQFVIGPYQKSDNNQPELWRIPLNQGSSSTGRQSKIEWDQLPAQEGDFKFEVRNIKLSKINVAPIIDVSSKSCPKQATFYSGPKYLAQTMRDVFSDITGIRDNWPRKSDLVWGFPKADVFKQQIGAIIKGNDKPDANKDFPRQNGMMTIYEVEAYLQNYYGEETYLLQAARLKWGMVMSIRFDIRMRQLAKLYPDASSLFYHLIGFYHTQERLDEDKASAKTFIFSKKYTKYVNKLFRVDIEADGNNIGELVRMLPFYIVRTSPQFFRTGGIEYLSLKKKKKPRHQEEEEEEIEDKEEEEEGEVEEEEEEGGEEDNSFNYDNIPLENINMLFDSEENLAEVDVGRLVTRLRGNSNEKSQKETISERNQDINMK